MSKPRLHAGERRVAIVEAAKPLFAQHGFSGTTTKQIARSAGVSEALVFQHFPSKAALYREILRLGCEGDPGLERLRELEPSTASLVEMIGLLIRHVAMGVVSDIGEKDVEDRLALHSLLEDGEYVRLVSDWVVDRILPTFSASYAAAGHAGDLRADAGDAANAFWFAHHAAAMTAFGRLCGRPVYPYRGTPVEVMAELARFILRGIGLRDAAIEAHFDPASLQQPNLSVAA
jgi:AcrR family transcriptional regulator